MNHDLNAGDEISAATVILTGSLKKALREYAVRHGISVSEVARTALRNHLERHHNTLTNPAKGNSHG